MSDQAADAFRRIYERASRLKDPSGRVIDAHDPATLDAVLDGYQPDVEVHEDPRFPEAGVYRGVDAARAYFSNFLESFDEFTFEAEDFIDLGENRVLVPFRVRTRGKESGVATEIRPAWVFKLRDAKVSRVDAYLDRSEAFAAVGLERA